MKPNWFVGIPLPLPNLHELLAQLPSSCRGFQAEDLHMTIAFMGAMAPAKRAAVQAMMATLDTKPFLVSLGTTCSLPTPKRPSAFCVALDRGHQNVVTLINNWRGPLLEVGGGRPDKRSPLPHVTIARPIRRFGAQAIEEGNAWLARVKIPKTTFLCDRLALYTWADDRRKALFKKVFEIPWA